MHVGARIRLISDGDVGAIIEVAQRMTSNGTPADVLLGTGGTAEGQPPTATPTLMNSSLAKGLAVNGYRFSLKSCSIPLPDILA